MKGKTLIILFLITLLVFTVYKMMKYEKSIREKKNIKLYIEDASKPLIKKLSAEELRNAALNSTYFFIAEGDYFKELKTNQQEEKSYWDNIFLKGVNLGVALPGKFPSEFSLTFSEYLHWFDLIGKMNANVIRVYTILPPDFYKAFSYYNLHHYDKHLFLMQGIWADNPKEDDYYDPDYIRNFQKEIIDIIDVIHGNTVLKEKVGKASGVYTTDVSKYVLAFLLGNEWEPAIVFKTNKINKTLHYNGDFVCMNNGNAMEAWLANMMDFTVMYETQTYRWQHPVSFVNWLPLDPMYHNTEIIENPKVREYDNDLESIDFQKFNSTDLFYPGIYAAYHAYPYYPDFIFLQKNYANTVNNKGQKDNYFGYLTDLKQHTQDIPLIIAEYGLPSSRGNSHFATPFGFNQGGLSEAQQAKLSLLLTKDIFDTKCAGAIFFEWADEWFKHNWLVMDFEQPYDDRQLWHNMENPEENFGVLALESRTKTIDGELNDWNKANFKDNKYKILADADPGYFYLASNLPGFDFRKNNLYIAIDVYDRVKGDHKLPFSNKEFKNGFEFLCKFTSTDNAQILVDEPYSVFTDIYNDHIPIYVSINNNNGKFIEQFMLVNRGRETLLGKKTDPILSNRSPLIFGNSSKPEYSNADWYWNNRTKKIEIRLDWHLLNVSDPAKRFVLDDKKGTSEIDYSKTDAFNLYFFITDKKNNVIKQYPERKPFSYNWEEWDVPVYKARLKPVYYSLQNYFKKLKPVSNINSQKLEKETFAITDFYDNKKGAISVSFDNAGFSQYEYALPVLQKYQMKATFSMISEMANDSPELYDIDEGIKIKRLSLNEIKDITNLGHEIALQTLDNNFTAFDAYANNKSNKEINVLHLHNSTSLTTVPRNIVFARKEQNKSVFKNEFSSISYYIANKHFGQVDLDNVLKLNKNKWTILSYHHLYNDSTQINNVSKNILDQYFVKLSQFERQIRLIRNSGYWVATESDVFKYLKEKQSSKIETSRYENLIFLKVKNSLDKYIFDKDMTIIFYTKAKIIKISGSATDGIYTNRTGNIIFNVFPGKEVTLEIIE